MRNTLTLIAGCLLVGLSTAYAAVATISETPSAVRLENDRVTLVLSKDAKGAMQSLADKPTGVEFVAKQAQPALFHLGFSTKGQARGVNTWVSSADAGRFTTRIETKGVAQAAVLQYDDLRQSGVNVTCTATLSEGDPLVRWRLAATFPDTLVLEEVQFPVVTLAPAIGGDVADDALVIGSTKGGVLRRPGDMTPGGNISGTQPGNLAAEFGCYYDARAGLYTAAYDGKGYPKTVSYRRTSEGIEANWTEHCFASSPFALAYDVVMTTFNGSAGVATDWRDAADIYKRWALTQAWCARTYAQRPDIPAWMKSGPAMVRFYREMLTDPTTIQHWLDGYWRKQFTQGPLVTAYWGWEKVATWVTPDYFPVYPTDKAFTDLVAWSRQRACHTFLWPSGYHWTLTYDKQPEGSFAWDDRARFDTVAAAHAVRNRDGKVWSLSTSWLEGGATACMCPGDPWTVAWWNREIAEPIARRGGEIIQFDQVVGAGVRPCYSTEHGHPPGPGLWMTQVFEKQLKTEYAACKKIQPDAVVCFEEPNERFNHLIGIQDYRDCESPYELASVFNYLYHEYLPTFQSNPRRGDTFMTAYCFANGQIPHLIPSMDVGPGPALVNGDFETWTGKAFRGWEQVKEYRGEQWTGTWARDLAEKHGGSASLRLDNATDADIVQVSQNVPIGGGLAVGNKYRLSAWIKTDHMKAGNNINAATFTADWKGTAQCQLPYPAAGTGWQHVSGEFTALEGSVLLRIMIHIQGQARVWVDDMTLEQVLPDGKAVPTMRPETPPDHKLMRRWVELYHGEGRPYLALGRMLHPPQLAAATVTRDGKKVPAILHNAYRAADGSEACVLVNATDAPQSGEVQWRGKAVRVTLQSGEAQLLR